MLSIQRPKRCYSSIIIRAIGILDQVLSNIIRKMKLDFKLKNPFECGEKKNSLVQVVGNNLPSFSLNEFRLLAVTSVYISSKLDDIYPLNKKDALTIYDKADCDMEKLIRFEFTILEEMNYKIGFPLPTDFIEFFVSKYFTSLGKEYKKHLKQISNISLLLHKN